MTYQTSNNNTIEYEIIRKKNKNIYFRVKDDLKLYIYAPMYLSGKSILKLIAENETQILKMYEHKEDKKKDIDKFIYLGKKYYIEEDASVISVTFKDQKVLTPSQDALLEFTREKIEEIYGKEIELCKKCFSRLPEFTWRVRDMKTRWGVCNTKKNIITLNTELIKKDIELIDYVIIHEISHFFEGNHGKKFWHIVSLACPNYKECRKKLKE